MTDPNKNLTPEQLKIKAWGLRFNMRNRMKASHGKLKFAEQLIADLSKEDDR